jgi:adenylate kinase family enzyme
MQHDQCSQRDCPQSPVLIVIRGNSGSGKSSVAQTIREYYGHRDLAVIGQDVVRRQMLRELDVPGAANIDLIDTIVRWTLSRGYHVLLEGILAASRYGDMLARLRYDYPVSHWIYLDVPFEETVRRHRTRPQRDQFTPEQMAEWYQTRDLLPRCAETVIGPQSTLHATADLILQRSGLAGGARRECNCERQVVIDG